MDRLLYRVPEAAELLGVSRAFLYREIAAGRLKPVKLGAATRIPAEELRRYVERLKLVEIGSRAHEEDAS